MSKKNKKKHEPHEEHNDESWLLPYSDLMTLLLALFIVLYGMSTLDAKKFEDFSQAFNAALTGGVSVLDQSTLNGTTKNTPTKEKDNQNTSTPVTQSMSQLQKRSELMKQEEQDLEKLKKQLDQYIKQSGLTSQLSTKLNQSQLLITISDNALFPSGSAAVKPEARVLAKALSGMLEKFPDYEILISGHTDNVPIDNEQFASNWDLSFGRARNFMEILLLNNKLNPKMFSPIGYGEYHPVADNSTEAGRAKNRRVEISIIRKYQDPSSQITITP
ncbi:flagellar motor protein MotB [Paenibacillus physcomitrellae]|uniref:Flagellar motor protein MotB n=1 Tax=Paenibacillus physcomitrellae TaxID=1619311 RepID=A0ABQ1GZI8_9BACL|nr:flagellar motor protein MotB [Paenibacillus physcomitrellae]GGA53062.1 flagellar motor protein MotB [Paenibacillus physcomitrellae]